MIPLFTNADPYPNTGGYSVEEAKNQDWYKLCLQVKDAQIPNEDQPPLPEAAGCSAEELYYDSTDDAGWIAAKRCAIATNDYEILMMLYANGRGGVRNYDLAIKFACSTSAGGSGDSNVLYLKYIKEGKFPDGTLIDRNAIFDQCDNFTSGFMEGRCAWIKERANKNNRERRLARVTSGWSADQMKAYIGLRTAVDLYAAARSRGETDMSGTARAAAAIETQAEIEEQLVSDLENFEHGSLPAYLKERYVELDIELNRLYQKIQGDASYDDLAVHGTVKKEGIRSTQRAWLRYRDALVALGRARYPRVRDVAWKGLATERRNAELTYLSAE